MTAIDAGSPKAEIESGSDAFTLTLTLFVRLRLCVSLAVSETLTSVASVITSGAVSLMIPW